MKDDVRRFIEDLNSKFLRINWKGKEEVMRLAVRPIQLYEVAFPKELRDLILTTLIPNEESYRLMKEKKYGWLKKYVFLFRKLLKLKPLPDEWERKKKLMTWDYNVEKIVLGLRDDEPLLSDGKTEGI